MTQDEIRQCENFVLSHKLSEINHAENLHFLAMLIQDHDHLREKLMTEPDPRVRRQKLEVMRLYLDFKALPCEDYEMAEVAKSCGVQPIYEEQRAIEAQKQFMPVSRVHEVRD